jgi:hypothetical protein
MAKEIIFTKLANGFILVNDTNNRSYTLSPMCSIVSDIQHDIVRAITPTGHIEVYAVSNVLQVVNALGVVTPINDVTTLFNQLKDVCFTNNVQAELGSTNIDVNATITNANLEISNDVGNPIPTTNSLLELDSTQQLIDNQDILSELVTIKDNQTNGTQVVSDGKVQALTDTQLRATPLALSTGASTSALQTSGNVLLGASNETVPANDTASSGLNGRLQRIAQRLTSLITVVGTPLQAGGSVNVSNASIAVTGAFFQATQPISGTVTANTGLTQPLTDTQLRASALPVSLASDADTTVAGTLGALNQTVVLNIDGGGSASFNITGTWVGTLTFQGSIDGTNWSAINAVSASASQPQTTTTVNGLYRLTPSSLLQIRVIMSAYTSGTATVNGRASHATGGVFANQILPVTIRNNTRTVYSIATTQPIVTHTTPNKDFIKIFGSASGAIYIKRIIVSGTTASAFGATLNVIKYSSLPTGGTATVLSAVSLDSSKASVATTASAYTVTTTSDGTALGCIFSEKFLLPVATSIYKNELIIDWTTQTNEGLVLLNANENIGLQLTAYPTGPSINITIIYEA